MGGRLEGPEPVEVRIRAGVRQLSVGWDGHEAVFEGGQLAAVVGLEYRLHVNERHQYVARVGILQQQVSAGTMPLHRPLLWDVQISREELKPLDVC